MKEKSVSRNEMRRQLVSGVKSGNLPMNEALKLARKILDKNQSEYAKLVGVSKRIIANFEINKGNPTLETINKLFSPVGLAVGLVLRSPG